MVGEVAEGLGVAVLTAAGGADAGEPGGLQQADGQVAQPRQQLGRLTFSHPAVVFAKAAVAHVEQLVFDVPVITRQLQQARRIGLIGPEARDAVGEVGGGLAVLGATSFKLKDLLHARPIEIIIQGRRAGQAPIFRSPVGLVVGLSLILFTRELLTLFV